MGNKGRCMEWLAVGEKIQWNLIFGKQIIEHIELQISLRKNNRIYRVAISKWERDLVFLRRL